MVEAPHPDNAVPGLHVPGPRLFPSKIAEERFDRITRIAAQSVDMPMALFTLIGEDGYWCKSHVGLSHNQAISLAALCGDILLNDGLLIVNDASREPRSVARHARTDDIDVTSYAGIPIRDPAGAGIGALYVLDIHPRQIDASKLTTLTDLAALLEREIAVDHLEHKVSLHDDHRTSIRALLDYLPEGVLMLGTDGVIEFCNAVAESMYGAQENGLIGRHASELTGEDPTRLRDALSAGDTDQLQAIARRLDGTEFIAEFSVKLLGASEAPRYALAVRDISVRKAQEHKLREADARRRKYFVTATHELRTPMASVLGFSELLIKRDFDIAERREMTGIIHRQASHLVNLINEMLDLARIESGGKDALDLRPQNPEKILAQTLASLAGLGATQRIECSIAKKLPSVIADAAKLQQALTNILSNAIKYSPELSDIRVDVFDTCLNEARAVAFRIVDQGIGMTAQQKAQVFDPFYRANSQSNMVGTGLGMTICKEIVELHGGIVKIESQLGAGTEIVILLPAAAPKAKGSRHSLTSLE